MKSRIWVGTLLATCLFSVLPPEPRAAEPEGTATGSADLVLGDDVVRGVSFTALTRGDGSASGQIEFYDPAPVPDQDVDGTGDRALAESTRGLKVYAEVECLAIDGASAIVGGRVIKSNVERYVGKQLQLFVQDGEVGRGMFSWGFYEPQEAIFCDTFPWSSYSPVAMAKGTLRVR
jgi:hypothetical protein